ncbi:MAG: SufE family protein [Bacteroidales bacterium]|nr:SufE family protein [Bacteroidales bacterium]
MSIEDIQAEIVSEMSVYDDWTDKYSYLIESGKKLEALDERLKTGQYLISGCQSRVWLVPELRDGKIWFRGESDAIIVKGLVALLLRIVSGHTPQEILEADFHFIGDVGLDQYLSPTRSNGMLAMTKQIKLYALAYEKISRK